MGQSVSVSILYGVYLENWCSPSEERELDDYLPREVTTVLMGSTYEEGDFLAVVDSITYGYSSSISLEESYVPMPLWETLLLDTLKKLDEVSDYKTYHGKPGWYAVANYG